MTSKADNNPYFGPWHLDCRLSAQLPSDDLIRGRFVVNLIAATLALGVITLACYLIYNSGSLRNEIITLQSDISSRRRLFNELNSSTKALERKVARLDEAYNLMAEPYRVSDFIVSVGRTRLPRMSFVSINGFAGGVVLRGILHEPSGTAAQTLRRYVADLQKDPAIRPLFATIALTSLERDEANESMTFEIACRLKGAPAATP